MGNSNLTKCPRCGASLPTGAADRICPACLMSGALAGPVDETLPLAPRLSPVNPDVTKFPCEFGGYRLLGLLGQGGMGRVYDALHISSGRRVALKMLGHQIDSPDMRQRFLREGRLAASVSHPNSLYIFGSEEIDGLPVITMEVANGGTLKDRLSKRGPLGVSEAVDLILDVIAGLEAAYRDGVLHRDVKPANCFVSPDGSVKIGDFGLSVSTLAKDDSYATATGVIMGTPAYASPEQLRGDNLDVRADIYSVAATLFTLLTNRVPFEGNNAVQVVANAVNQKPKPLSDFRDDIPPGLQRVISRCLAKEPDGRYGDYAALRNALLPFSSKEPEPATMKVRAPAGWIDYLIAFLIPYVCLMLSIGNEEFHFGFLMERTLYSARYYIAFLSCGLLYFAIAEGIWGAGFGKRFKGLRVVGSNGRTPGVVRALVRILIPITCIEGVRIPILWSSISATQIDDLTQTEIIVFAVATSLCPLLPIAMLMTARVENGFATLWDLLTRTRVVFPPTGTERPSLQITKRSAMLAEASDVSKSSGLPKTPEPTFGPYRFVKEIVPGQWLVAADPVLRRQVWLLRQDDFELSEARRSLTRPTRPRWLQQVETSEATWHAFESAAGMPFPSLLKDGSPVPWASLRHWLHEAACELWAAEKDQTLPKKLSLDHLWITTHGHAVLLDRPWPDVAIAAPKISVDDFAGQQKFLNSIAACVDSTSLPLHARPLLHNLAEGKFEKLSFLTGNLRGLLDKPAEVSRAIRALAIFTFPLYILIMLLVGAWDGMEQVQRILHLLMVFAGTGAVVQFLELPFRTTFSHASFGLAVVNAKGERATFANLLVRWSILWLPLLLGMLLVRRGFESTGGLTLAFAMALLCLWVGAALYAAMHPHRGLHDRLAGTWVVRR